MKNYYHSSCSHSRSMKKKHCHFLYLVKAHKKAAVKSRRFTESGCLVETFWSSSKINKQKSNNRIFSQFFTPVKWSLIAQEPNWNLLVQSQQRKHQIDKLINSPSFTFIIRWNLFNFNSEETRTALMTLLLTLNILHRLFECFHFWLWTSSLRLAS